MITDRQQQKMCFDIWKSAPHNIQDGLDQLEIMYCVFSQLQEEEIARERAKPDGWSIQAYSLRGGDDIWYLRHRDNEALFRYWQRTYNN